MTTKKSGKNVVHGRMLTKVTPGRIRITVKPLHTQRAKRVASRKSVVAAPLAPQPKFPSGKPIDTKAMVAFAKGVYAENTRLRWAMDKVYQILSR